MTSVISSRASRSSTRETAIAGQLSSGPMPRYSSSVRCRLTIRHSSVGETVRCVSPGWCRPRCVRAKLPTSWLSTSPNGGSASGGSRASNGFVPWRRVGRLHAREREHVHVRLFDVRARTRPHDGEHVGEHEHGDVGEQVVLLHVEHVVVAVRRRGRCPAPRFTSRTMRASIPRSVSPSGIGGIGRRRVVHADAAAHHLDERREHVVVAAGAALARRRQAVRLHEPAVARPDHLRAVDVVGHAEHLAVDALHVVRLAEALDERLPVAVGAAPRSAPGSGTRRGGPTRCRPGPARGTRRAGSASGSRFTNTIGPHVSTCTAISG